MGVAVGKRMLRREGSCVNGRRSMLEKKSRSPACELSLTSDASWVGEATVASRGQKE